jgi:hypothetical protein
MKTYRLLFILIASLIVFSGCENDDDPQPEPQINYGVRYKLDLQGEFSNVSVTYYEPNTEMKTTEPTDFPWELNLSNYSSGDTVSMEFSFTPVPLEPYSFTGLVEVTNANDGSVVNSGGPQGSVSAAPNDNPISRAYEYVIP